MSQATQAKKLVLVLATSALVTGASKETSEMILVWVPCIHYPVQFWKNKATIWALIDLGSEVNTITLVYAKQLALQVQKTDVGAQKIDGSLLWTFGMVIAGFQVEDKLDKARIVQELFLLAETSIEMVLGMFFFILSNADI